MKPYFIYALKDPVNGNVRYVGVTTDTQRRYEEHLRGIKQGRKVRQWVKSLMNQRRYPDMVILEEVKEEQWEEKEKYWIRFYRDKVGKKLKNGHYGGSYQRYSPEKWGHSRIGE